MTKARSRLRRYVMHIIVACPLPKPTILHTAIAEIGEVARHHRESRFDLIGVSRR